MVLNILLVLQIVSLLINCLNTYSDDFCGIYAYNKYFVTSVHISRFVLNYQYDKDNHVRLHS